VGDSKGAREAYAEAAAIVNAIAANVSDTNLRTIFLSSNPVRKVLEGSE
jgi:hypothetical protein